MANITSGVYPVYKNQFKVGADSISATVIEDMESFSVSFDNGIEEWTPFSSEGWRRALMTAKALTISCSGKRNVGDAGNDFIASKAFVNGRDGEGVLEWAFPDGTKVTIPCVFNVTNIGAGDAIGVAPLEFDAISNGKPTVAEPTPTV